jgi:DNA-binding NarL/FixJ family response regulator
MVASGNEAQRLVDEIDPHVVVLDADLPDESGWLSAAKILLVDRAQRVFVLAPEADDALCERARSLGAVGLVRRADGPEALAGMIFGPSLSVAV